MKARVCVLLVLILFLTGGLGQVDIFEIVRNGSLEDLKAAVESGADVNAAYLDGTTLLMEAIRYGQYELVQPLLNAGAGVNLRNNRDESPLLLAASGSDPSPDIIRTLLNAGAFLNLQSEHDLQILTLVVNSGANPEVLELLLNAGAVVTLENLSSAARNTSFAVFQRLLNARMNMELTDSTKGELLLAAAGNEDIEILKSLLTLGADVNYLNEYGWTPLQISAHNENPKALNLLLDAGANVNVADKDGTTPLMVYAAYNPNSNAIDLLLKAGADVNAQSNYGDTALSRAIGSSHSEIFDLLLTSGADVNLKDVSGVTLLMEASKIGNLEMIQKLLKAGVDTEAKDINGWTALTYAQQQRLDEKIIQMLGQSAPKAFAQMNFFDLVEGGTIEEVQVAFQEAVDINAYDSYGYTALIRASRKNPHPEVIQFLINNGAKISQKNAILYTPMNARSANNASGFTALTEAARSNLNPEVVKVLINAGADINGEDGRVPLIYALEYNENPNVAYAFIELGADVNEQNGDGSFPLKIAVLRDDLKLAKALLEAGAIPSARSGSSQGPQFASFEPVYGYLKSIEMADLLFEFGLEVNPDTSSATMSYFLRALSKTPIMYLAESNSNPDILKLFLEEGGNVNAADLEGRTALMFAARSNPNPEIITTLLTYGADPLMVDSAGKTAFDYIQMNEALKNTEAYRQLETRQ